MEIIPYKPLKSIWLKASVAGSIWASIEIILGSFLHNLKLPLSGMILSFISVWLLISFFQIWKEKGLIWRAGLICALMKSISPSAFIFGPMIGIFTEALIIYLFIFIFGKNIIAYSIGGALAVLSTLLQKVVSLLILYGFDFIKILTDLYKYGVKQIGLEQLSPIWLLTVITGIYIVAGITGAIGGYLTGLKYLKTEKLSENQSEISLKSKEQLFSQAGSQKYSVILLIINILSIAAILFLINSDLLIPTIIVSLAYVIFCFLNYKVALKRISRPSFWITFLIITFAAAFLWNGFSGGAFFSMNGLIVGLKMNARAIIIVLGFASISVELRNPVIKSLLFNRGFADLYQALSLAFSALPFFISTLSNGKNKKGLPRIKFADLFSQAEILLKMFEKEHHNKPQVVLITGGIHQGKTTFTQKLVTNLLEKKIKVTGFLSIGVDANGERKGFDLYDIETGERFELCSNREDENRLQFGQYYFNIDAFLKGNHILGIENISGKQLIVIDEIGPLELNNQGWANSIETITRMTSMPHVWVVRQTIIRKIIRKWNVGNAYVFDISESAIQEVQDKIEEILGQNPVAEE